MEDPIEIKSGDEEDTDEGGVETSEEELGELAFSSNGPVLMNDSLE